MKRSRGMLQPLATARKLQQEAGSCCWWSAGRALGLHSVPTSSTMGSSATPMQAELRMLYPKGSISPQAHPTPNSITDGYPKPPHRDNGSVPLWASSWTHTIASAEPEQACCASRSCWGPASLSVVRELQAQHETEQHCKSPSSEGGSIKYPCTQCNLQLSGKDSHKTFPHSSLKTFVH